MARDSQNWMSIVKTVLTHPEKASKPYLLELLADGYELMEGFRVLDDTNSRKIDILLNEVNKFKTIKAPEIAVGQKGWYLYDLFGEHLIQEMFVTEIEMDCDGIKSIHTSSADNHQRQFFSRNLNTLRRFTVDEETALKWKENRK